MTIGILTGLIAQPAMNRTGDLEITGWVYFFGTDDGSAVKIGYTASSLEQRHRELERGQLSRVQLRLLAAVRGTRTHETGIKNHFAFCRADVNSTEAFDPAPELVEYINWLRQQWWTWVDEDEGPDEEVPPGAWYPAPGRRVLLQQPDPETLVQVYETNGRLAGTAWCAMSDPGPSIQDYYTPSWLIDLAREAMGEIDLDAASHFAANRVHKIPVYYHSGRSAFHNPWAGRVWLNPPYGDNAPWFAEIIRYWDCGDVTQLCMLSPVWAFSALQAAPVIARSSAMLLLSPTPGFWGRNRKGEIRPPDRPDFGSNHPHAILYLGPRVAEFRAAFAGRGIPMSLEPLLEEAAMSVR